LLARRAALLLATGLALAATPGSARADRSVTIGESEFRLDPSSFNATAGEVVHFTIKNTGGAQHNLEFELESAKIEKKLFDTNLQPGETRTVDFTFSQAGKWEMYCPVDQHRQRGMSGDVTVAAAAAAPAAPAPAPAPAAPAAPAPAAPMAPAAQPAQPAAPAAPVAMPAQLPRTGGGPALPLALGLAGLGLLGGGLLARRRR
jgi:LPXTG-motif cell wall-anchored protein